MSIVSRLGRLSFVAGGMIAGATWLMSAGVVSAGAPDMAGVQMAQAQPAAPAPATGAAATPAGPKIKVAKLNKKACRAELASLCAATTTSRTKCLIANQSKLGPECAAAVAVAQQAKQVAKASCVLDAAKLCGSAVGAARVQCLESNKAQLTPSCLARLEKKDAKLTAPAAAPATPPKQ